MQSRNSLSKVSIEISDLIVAHVLVAKFQKSIGAAIPQIIALLGDSERDVRKAGADAFSKLSEQGKYRIFEPERC